MIESLELPDGWEVQPGAGGWRCIQPSKKWETNVYQDDAQKGSGQSRAIEAAVSLQTRAEKVLHDQQRLCAELRACFMGVRHD